MGAHEGLDDVLRSRVDGRRLAGALGGRDCVDALEAADLEDRLARQAEALIEGKAPPQTLALPAGRR
jgi:hypothetical protein